MSDNRNLSFGRLLPWVFIQNVPIIFGTGLGATVARDRNLLFGVGVSVFGAFLTALVIELTQKYKLNKPNRKIKYKDLLYNSFVFGIAVAIYTIYANFGNIITDLLVGFILGFISGIIQTYLLKLDIMSGVRRSITYSLIGLVVLLGIRLSMAYNIGISLLILVGINIIMAIIMTIFEYRERT